MRAQSFGRRLLPENRTIPPELYGCAFPWYTMTTGYASHSNYYFLEDVGRDVNITVDGTDTIVHLPFSEIAVLEVTR